MKEFEVGDLVLLTLDSPGLLGITDGLWEYKDRIFRISRVKLFPGNGKTDSRGTYYELKGLESDAGVPYAITPDWIRPMRELKR